MTATISQDEMDMMLKEIEDIIPPTKAAPVSAAIPDDMVEAALDAIEPAPKAATVSVPPTAEESAAVRDKILAVAKDASEAVVFEVAGDLAGEPANLAPAPKAKKTDKDDGVGLKSFIDPEQVKVDIAINPTDLDDALIKHPSLELHYAMQTAHARRQYERMKSAVEILEANLDAKHRKLLSEDTTKKVTEALITSAVKTDPAYSAAQGKLIDAQHYWKLCEATENAFHSRKDMLLEVARDRRKEKEGAMRVLEDAALRERAADIVRAAAKH